MSELQPKLKEKTEKSEEDPNHKQEQEKVDDRQSKTKKKKKVKHRKHPPQYYEQLKLVKINKKRQEEWDSRFIIESIPADLSRRRRAFSSKKGSSNRIRHSETTKQAGNAYKIFHEEAQRKQKPSRSFNIRIVTKKQEKESVMLAKKQEPVKKQQAKQDKMEEQRNNLVQLINKAHLESNFANCHKDLLIDIVRKSKQKTINSYIHAQIARIKGRSSLSTQIQASIKKRSEAIQNLQQIPSLDSVQQYRLTTIKVIQQILRWREQMEKVYKQQTHTKPRIIYSHEGENYLLQIGKEQTLKVITKQFQYNPFLLGFDNQVIDIDLLVKIRACEMLLLEQQLSQD